MGKRLRVSYVALVVSVLYVLVIYDPRAIAMVTYRDSIYMRCLCIVFLRYRLARCKCIARESISTAVGCWSVRTPWVVNAKHYSMLQHDCRLCETRNVFKKDKRRRIKKRRKYNTSLVKYLYINLTQMAENLK